MRIVVVEPVARGGLIHHAYMLCRGLAREGAGAVEVTLITGRGYELADLPHGFRVEPILRLWDAKPSGSRSGAGASPPGTGSRMEGQGVGGSRLGSGSPREGHEEERGLRGLASNAPGEEAPAPGRRAPRLLRRVGRGVVWYREWVRLALRLRRLRPDVVQLGDVRFPGDLAALWLLRAFGLRLADVCHNVEPFGGGGFSREGLRGRLVRPIYRRIYRCFDVVFVHYRVNRDAFLRLYGLPRRRVRAIPLGNFGLFEELRGPVRPDEIRRRLDLPEEAPVILLFGSLSPYKGPDLLLEAFARLRAERRDLPDARLVLAGHPLEGFDSEAYLARARERGLPDTAVTVVPEYIPSDEVAAWMETAAVAVCPYREIYQSGALQTALTFGVPAVASRVGALTEVIRDGETGLLVPPGDADALAAALGRLLEDAEWSRRLGTRAAAEQRRRFGWDRVARRILAGYRALLRPAGDPGAADRASGTGADRTAGGGQA